jgi:(p)ppGpp synthase/HD superfamily hydrolase
MTKTLDGQRLLEALRFALGKHGDQTRKGTAIPYASHLLQVAGLVLEHGGDTDQAVAGLLHDVVEDCDVPLTEVRERFGPAVARMVDGCSDLLEGDTSATKSPWRERKQHAVAKLQAADAATRLVAACDKLHNLRCIVHDLESDGTAAFERFNAGLEETLWYQRAMHEALGHALPEPLEREISELLAELEALMKR